MQIFAYREVLEDWVLAKVNDRWRDHKFHVKKVAYEKWNSVQEHLAHPPDNVVESQWRILVEVWEKDVKKQAICAVNKENRKKQNIHHTTGSKAHAKCAAELGKKLGWRPKRHEVFGVTHTKKKKTEDPDEVLMDPEVAAQLKEMEEVEIQASHQVLRLCYKDDMMHLQKQQLENTLAELQAATQRIAELEALVVHDEPGTSNIAYQAALDRIAKLEAQLRTYKTVTSSTDAEIRNSP
ncbi:hypothetical protein MKW98_007136 [Papaver atlanticum]|uniref:Uncharacterized protein n=1 Tax=Papaver atlanticum TaxID=357466 RepID=A0AAD4XHG1_9MAGN|nr:hypothetical protein MKW98_007136 [Papaver atlanticum]